MIDHLIDHLVDWLNDSLVDSVDGLICKLCRWSKRSFLFSLFFTFLLWASLPYLSCNPTTLQSFVVDVGYDEILHWVYSSIGKQFNRIRYSSYRCFLSFLWKLLLWISQAALMLRDRLFSTYALKKYSTGFTTAFVNSRKARALKVFPVIFK